MFIFKLHITGQGSLGFSGKNVKVHVEKIAGDTTGLVTVRPSQRVNMKSSDGLLPFSFLVQKNATVELPGFTTCRSVEVMMRGTMEKMQNLTVGPHCKFVIQNSTETSFSYDHVVVQTDGFMAVDRDDQAHVTVAGKTLDIRGGGRVSFG